MVVLEQPAQSLSGLDNALALRFHPADHLVSVALMTTFVVIVSRVLGDGSDERFLPQEDHLIETLRT